jgi:hypothetical protein
MRKLILLSTLVLFAGVLNPSAFAQEPIRRDPQAVVLVAQAVQAMGGGAPGSSLAVGWIDIEEGSLTDSGPVRILTRGLEESREEFQLGQGARVKVYSQGLAARERGSSREVTSLEFAASSQTPAFPLVILAGALNNPESAFEFVGLDDFYGTSAYHIRFWNTFASQPELHHLAEFTVKDLWINAATGLPHALYYEEREGGGSAPRILVGAIYSDYRSVGGALYPFLIQRIFNGTPWATIKITNVVLNSGLSNSEFFVQ